MEDNPELDGTDAAHPAWWRGQEHGAVGITISMMNAFKEPRHSGKFSNPLMNELREKIWSVQEKIEKMTKIVSVDSELGKILRET